MLALSADRALMVLPAASKAMRAALRSEVLLNIGVLVPCQWPKWDSSTTLLQPPNDFKDARARARGREYASRGIRINAVCPGSQGSFGQPWPTRWSPAVEVML